MIEGRKERKGYTRISSSTILQTEVVFCAIFKRKIYFRNSNFSLEVLTSEAETWLMSPTER